MCEDARRDKVDINIRTVYIRIPMQMNPMQMNPKEVDDTVLQEWGNSLHAACKALNVDRQFIDVAVSTVGSAKFLQWLREECHYANERRGQSGDPETAKNSVATAAMARIIDCVRPYLEDAREFCALSTCTIYSDNAKPIRCSLQELMQAPYGTKE